MIELRVTIQGPSSSELQKELGRYVDDLMQDTLQVSRKYTPIRSGQARRAWKKIGQGRNSRIENTVPYIERLDAGTSRQAPKGIIKPTLDEISKRNR